MSMPPPPAARMSSRQSILFVAFVCLCAVLTAGPATAQGDAPSPTPCGPRVRRGWATLTTPEKQLYLDAVMKAMSTGLHTLFHEVHADNDSGNEAHLTCGMIYWHRRFILAYENMLRSLEPRFACLTIPYWDYYADFAKRSTGFCTTLEGCSTFLMDLGGSTGPVETHTLGNNSITSNCVSGGVGSGTNVTFSNVTIAYNYTIETRFNMSDFCETSATTPSNCSRCMPRGNWTTTPFPSGFGYASLAKLISASLGFQSFAQNLHYGMHNSIHNAAGSTMATLSTSADPIFYNHHAMGDLVHQMWYDCQVKRPMTEYEKKNSNYAFATCSQSAAITAPSRLANITQYWTNGVDRIRADDHPVLRQFFSPLPIEYWQYVSGTDLGDFSYSYSNDGLLQSFADARTTISCPANSKARRMEQMFDFLPLPPLRTSKDTLRTEALKRMSALWDGLTATIMSKIKPTLAPTPSPTPPPTPSPTPSPKPAPTTQTPLNRPTLTPSPSVTPQPTTVPPAPVDTDTDHDRYLQALDQMVLMECAWYVKQGGFIDVWKEDFKRNMKLPANAHSPGYLLFMDLVSGAQKIDMDDWVEYFKAFLQVEESARGTPSGVNKPVGLEAVLDNKESTAVPKAGALTEEAGVVAGGTTASTSASAKGFVVVPSTVADEL